MAAPMPLKAPTAVLGSARSSFRGVCAAFQKLQVGTVAGRSVRLDVQGEVCEATLWQHRRLCSCFTRGRRTRT
jgi:hypothetical protein